MQAGNDTKNLLLSLLHFDLSEIGMAQYDEMKSRPFNLETQSDHIMMNFTLLLLGKTGMMVSSLINKTSLKGMKNLLN
jgi:hypothetical protein